MKIGIVIALVIPAIVALGLILALAGRNRQEVGYEGMESSLINKLETAYRKDPSVRNAVLLVDSPVLNLHIRHAVGEASPGVPMTPDTAFHSASVGKLYTAAAILSLIKEGKIDLDTRLGEIIDTSPWKDMLVVDGEDLLPELSIRELLAHQTGLPDHFEDKTDDGYPNLMTLIVEEPERIWTIESRLDYVRDHFAPLGRPGMKTHYADTNYDLLGLVVEQLTGKSFDDGRQELVIDKAGLSNAIAWPPFSNSDNVEFGDHFIAQTWVGDVEMSRLPSISIDGPGGGLAVTVDDQARFIRAIYGSEDLPGLDMFMPPDDEWGRFTTGIDYGYGLMAIRPGKLSPFLNKLPTMYGHSGITGSYLYYVPEYDAVITGTFNTTDWGRRKHIVFILGILSQLHKLSSSEQPEP